MNKNQTYTNMQIGGMLLGYYNLCPRKAWLSASGIEMEQESEAVALGRLLHETSYERTDKEVLLEAVYQGVTLVGKLDGANLRDKVLYEVKKSKSAEESHIWQIKFYLWLLALSGKPEFTAEIRYPLLRKTQEVVLEEGDAEKLGEMVLRLAELLRAETPPDRILQRKFCAKCAYEEYCYA
ncbi:MAG: CRISPR-associated protein Cas4 [Rhodothermia bacterium]|nr:CRISPR-associated protein Cas4 [Rhodothermia bacterium]